MNTVIAIACVVSVSVSVAADPSQQAADRSQTPRSATRMIDRFLSSGIPPLTSYKARRTLTASTRGGSLRASMQAWTYLEPTSGFHFTVLQTAGSKLIVDHVLRAALEAEERNQSGNEKGHAELTRANYEFQVDEDTRADGLVSIRLFPRRKTPVLLNGTVIVTAHDGDMVRIEGSPSEPPSFWTTRVDIVRCYARIAGVRVPVAVSSSAHVWMAGESTFSMTYDYTMINGRALDNPPAETPGR